GEIYEILSTDGDWNYISCIHDNYNGWIFDRKPDLLSDDQVNRYYNESPVFSKELIYSCKEYSLTYGSRLPDYRDGKFNLGDRILAFPGQTNNRQDTRDILQTALDYLNAPYLWGGRSIAGIDCSGLVQVVFMVCGISVPRDAWQQAERGTPVASLDLAKAGDLAFFSENGQRITHVGILTGDGHIIHASDWVRKDIIDDNGIFLTHLEKYGSKAVIINRLF
ncbi:MAG: C40 family peptidase, partial [Bacteroidota bacterium]|nr:C40 family peptidase [Bacteroidota bacterium]